MLEEDIALGRSYVVLEQGRIVGSFVFFIGHEPVYDVITNGVWHAEKPYGVIHRVASDGVTGHASISAQRRRTISASIRMNRTGRCSRRFSAMDFGAAGTSCMKMGKNASGLISCENKTKAH